MARKLTNNKGIPLPLAVWLGLDTYDHDPRPNTISVSTLLKSTRRIILSRRLNSSMGSTVDVADLLASRLGTSIHDSIENSWTGHYKEVLVALGYPLAKIEAIRINPLVNEPDKVNIYFEKRSERVLGNWIVVGKFDLCFNGVICDFKSTTVPRYIEGTNKADYIKQLSYYRWLNTTLVVKDAGIIFYIFKDFSPLLAGKKGYPPLALHHVNYPLIPVKEVEGSITNKLRELDHYMYSPEPDLPLCSPTELWQKPPKYKYYSPTAKVKASAVFDDLHSATRHMHTKGKGKGRVEEVPSTPVACKYCDVRNGCSQYAGYVQAGLLK